MRPGLAFVVSCALVGLAGVARAEDGPSIAPDNGLPMVHYRDEAARPGYHVVRSQMTGFFVVSTFLFATGYLGAVGIAASAKFEDGSAWLAVPVVGPFVGVANARSCGYFTPRPTVWDCTTSELGAVVALGILQTVAVVLFPFGFLHRRYWQRNTLVPTVSTQDGLRLGVLGTF